MFCLILSYFRLFFSGCYYGLFFRVESMTDLKEKFMILGGSEGVYVFSKLETV